MIPRERAGSALMGLGCLAVKFRDVFGAVAAAGVAVGLLVGTALLTAAVSTHDGKASDDGCRDYAEYGRHPGAKVTILAAIRGVEAEKMVRSLLAFKRCTGIDVVWEGRADLEAELARDLKRRTPPQLVVFNHPGQIPAAANSGLLQPASAELTTRAIRGYPVEWLTYSTVRGQFYAPPLGVTLKSVVWYSPTEFRRHRWDVPRTWDQLRALTEQVAREGSMKPWCEGLESGSSTGYPLTDWVEDVVLRLSGPDIYRQWTRHQVDFADPPVRRAFDEVSWFLRDPAHANGGFGDPASIASTPNSEAALPVLDGGCAMSRQSSLWANQWPGGTEIGPDGDVWTFELPSVDGRTHPLLVGGEFLARFGTDEASEMTQRFMISAEFTRLRAAEGGWMSPHRELRENWLAGVLDRENLRRLRDRDTVVAFDASDAMPDAVGSAAFWKQGVAWMRGQQSTSATLASIDAAWPR